MNELEAVEPQVEETGEIQQVLRDLLKDPGLGRELKALVALEGFRRAAEAGADPATAAREALELLGGL